ncbi:hypothetical protein GWI33_005358 [Rhynchophorus ferrugineus]|uniref:Uncharacterized protein n=1 Tax=Rhynchophorus ferrugineus TaxID=354439 RepID=A0A834MMT7_RHYFE|nr:hypothetical protein GWI33_005358 [Rhynchophorus ferrugineus]
MEVVSDRGRKSGAPSRRECGVKRGAFPTESLPLTELSAFDAGEERERQRKNQAWGRRYQRKYFCEAKYELNAHNISNLSNLASKSMTKVPKSKFQQKLKELFSCPIFNADSTHIDGLLPIKNPKIDKHFD